MITWLYRDPRGVQSAVYELCFALCPIETNEFSFGAIDIKMGVFCTVILMHNKFIFILNVLHNDSLEEEATDKWLFIKNFNKRTCQWHLDHETLCAEEKINLENVMHYFSRSEVRYKVDGRVWPVSSNPYSISEQIFDFSYLVCRPWCRIKDYERFGSVWPGRQIAEYFSLLQRLLKVRRSWRFLSLIHGSSEIFLSDVKVGKCKSCSHYAPINKYTKSDFERATPIFNDTDYFLHQTEDRFGMDWCGANGEAKFGVWNICTWKMKRKSPMRSRKSLALFVDRIWYRFYHKIYALMDLLVLLFILSSR